jgi:hypothetical protein
MRRATVTLLASLAVLAPAPVDAWGFEAHRLIADRAIDLLPEGLKALFQARRAFIVERSVDPDLWRNAGWEAEPPNHFLDMDHEAFGPYPFEGLPRDYAAAVQKFGREFVHEQGLLPWRVQEFYGKLQRAFASLARPAPPTYALDDIVFYSAILAHYVSDGHVPLHAVVNYDGQLTNQRGVHSRWEVDLFERNRQRLAVAPAPPKPVTAPRDFMFDVLLASNREAAAVLESDRTATKGREFYDDAYFAAFADGALPGLERRLNASITAVASIVSGAWEQAGRPAVAASVPRTPRKIPRQ